MKVNPFPLIEAKLYGQPWCIVPEKLRSIASQFEAFKAGKHKANDPDGDGDYQADDTDELMGNSLLPSSNDTLAVIPVFGIIGQHLSMLETMCGGVDVIALADAIKTARDNPEIQNIVLYFNSPGGTVTGVPELAQLIADTDTVKPVFAFTDSEICSAAYWLASQCRAIVATPSSCVGSIGVYCIQQDNSAFYAKEGIKFNAFSAGDNKLTGADFKPMTDDEKELFQDRIDSIYSGFTGAVKSKRSVDTDKTGARVYFGEDAVNLGLADGLANDFQEFVDSLT